MKKSRLNLFIFGGVVLFAGLLACILMGIFGDSVPPAPAFSRAPVLIDFGNGQSRAFNMEVAQTPDQLAYGLMYRKEMSSEDGMIFVFNPPQDAVMWMKNTFVPLDMIFVRTDGSVARIVPFTMPMDETRISSGEAVAAVIELKAGEAVKHHITKASKVIFQGLAPAPVPASVVPAEAVK